MIDVIPTEKNYKFKVYKKYFLASEKIIWIICVIFFTFSSFAQSTNLLAKRS